MALLFPLATTTWWIPPWPFPANLLTPDPDQAPNFIVKIQSASCQWGCKLYTKDNIFRSRVIANTGWLQYFIAKDDLKPSGLRWSKGSLTTIHRPLSTDQKFIFLPVPLYPSNPTHLAALGILMQSNKGGSRLMRDFGRIQLNVFNQLLHTQLMGFLVTKAI